MEAASNFIRNSGVEEEEPVVITKPSKQSLSSSSKSNKPNKSNNSSDTKPSSMTSDDQDFSAEPSPNVKRTVTTTSETSASDSALSPRSKGKLEEIIDSYRTTQIVFPSGTKSSAIASGVSPSNDGSIGAISPTPSVASTKSYHEDLKNFNNSNLEFLYEAFPDLKHEYCKTWLRRYNGDLVKTCDYLTRVSQVELPQNEDDDVIELDEDIEMIDLTQDVRDDESDEDDDDDDDRDDGIMHFIKFLICVYFERVLCS